MQAASNRATSFPAKAIVNGLAVFGAVCAAAILVIGIAFAADALRAAQTANSTNTMADPLAAPQTVDFRASERGESPTYVGDALAAPWVVEFRITEHAAAAQPWTGDPLAAPSLVEFRTTEHAEAP